MTTTLQPLDDRDSAICAQRVASLEENDGPRVGDYVRFADGVERRISFVTPAEWLPDVDSIQTSDGGSWYLGDGYANFSGGLHPGVKRDTLTLTDETQDGLVWFFHHDFWQKDNGVYAYVPFRVYECSQPASA